jgi:signal peptidase II
MAPLVKRFWLLAALIVVILVLDQLSKWWVVQHIAPGETVYPIPALAPFFAITFVQNTGAAFGLFQNTNALLAVLAVIIVAVIVRTLRALPPDRLLARVALSLLIAGAIGNLIDRVRLGYAIDFVAVGSFARFNVADSAVTTGVALLLLIWLLERPKNPIHDDHEEAQRNPL